MWDYLEEFARDANQPHQVMNIAHAKMLDRFNREREKEQLKKEIIEEVLSRISIMFETGEAVILMISMKHHNAPRIQRQTIHLTVMTLRQTLWTKRKP